MDETSSATDDLSDSTLIGEDEETVLIEFIFRSLLFTLSSASGFIFTRSSCCFDILISIVTGQRCDSFSKNKEKMDYPVSQSASPQTTQD